tara:strand:+ start:1586 stop:2515 length:930 start_codon:yes stop_codon:yes gene_type:complete
VTKSFTKADVVAIQKRLKQADVPAEQFLTEDYHNSPGVSTSLLKLFATDQAAFREIHVKKTRKFEVTEAMRFGSDVESWVFNGASVGDWKIIPREFLSESGQRRGSKWTSYKQAQLDRGYDESQLMTPDEWENKTVGFDAIRRNILQHRRAHLLMTSSHVVYHPRVRWLCPETGMLLRGELDSWLPHKNLIADLKTSKVIKDAESFSRHAYRLKWHWQAAMYLEAMQILRGQEHSFVFVVAQSTPGYTIRTYDMDESFLDLARDELSQVKKQYKKCASKSGWKQKEEREVVTVSPPNWAGKTTYQIQED